MSTLYTNLGELHNIHREEWAAFKEALTIYYSTGCSITDAFAQVESGLIDRYYRRKKKYPEEIEQIDAEALAASAEERSARLTAFEAWQVMASIHIQKRAIDILLTKGLAALERIVKSEPWDITDEKTGEKKPVPIYPRDRLNAMRLMKELAREGLLPRGYVRQSQVEEKKVDVKGFISMPYSGARTDFEWLSVTKPDGETVTVHVNDTEDDMERRVSRLSASLPEDE